MLFCFNFDNTLFSWLKKSGEFGEFGSHKEIYKMIFWVFLGNDINPFFATGLFLYPLKISENLWIADVFRGYRKIPVPWTELKSPQNCWKVNVKIQINYFTMGGHYQIDLPSRSSDWFLNDRDLRHVWIRNKRVH